MRKGKPKNRKNCKPRRPSLRRRKYSPKEAGEVFLSSAAEADQKDAKIPNPVREASDARWAEMLTAWKQNPRSIPMVVGSQWYEKKYSHCLASYPGDPAAWVSSPAQAREVARKKGLIGSATTMEIRN